jgi:hypothetical protein
MFAQRVYTRTEMMRKPLIYMARPEGFEPPTHCFEGRG